jgi:hypothetical protein
MLGVGAAMAAATQLLGLSGRTVLWAPLGFGMTLWATCFVWHDLRALRAVGRPGTLFGALARWAAWAVALPVTLTALFAAIWLGSGGGMDDDRFAGIVMGLGVVISPFAALIGTAFYRTRKPAPVRSTARAATAAPEVRGVSPVRPTQPNRAAEREAYLLDYLLSLCHNDRALCERLVEQERGLHPHLPQEEILELVIQSFRADNR